ncbi:hypothetical protein ISF_08044 [Cordyceps fumosorosea ARSEF 2679]|uniref:Uncharacterized protein n=1 Tax=Cordyceps fumosorosea (strain ARSEF 2679) TaxID=1081104 RepID=A0A167N4P7_CORFA|nr:hypothetical protein ISF_08044 [Cordyceps fumosorosea ARSEF 2679]OAA55123.1 hypothetical protein ISF_08044 [Cordyceps fumosorosea ARSEF 2679]
MADHTDSPVADLIVLSYDQDAPGLCRAGFFCLDLRTVDELLVVAREYFAKPLKENSKDMYKINDAFKVCGPWQRRKLERWHINTCYSVLFFLRPNNNASFTDSEGVSWRAVDWLSNWFDNPSPQPQRAAGVSYVDR